MDHALVTVYGPCGTCSPTRPEGKGAVKLAPLRPRSGGERGAVKLVSGGSGKGRPKPLRRRRRGERAKTPPPTQSQQRGQSLRLLAQVELLYDKRGDGLLSVR